MKVSYFPDIRQSSACRGHKHCCWHCARFFRPFLTPYYSVVASCIQLMCQTDNRWNQISQVAAGLTCSAHPALLPRVAFDHKEILDAIDVSIVVLDRNFTIANFNRPATEALGIAISDIGRPARDVAGLAHLRNLERWCADVISIDTTSRYDFRNKDQTFVLRIAPYSKGDNRARGTVLTFTNVTAFRASIDQAIYEREYTKAILNARADPLVVLSQDLCLQTANRAFHQMFGILRESMQSTFARFTGKWKL